MCGIIGYVGRGDASKIVIDGLKKLEYRGYDSWGVALKDNGDFTIKKKVGKIGEFNESLPESHLAIGHSRWATHGKVLEKNSHPHASQNGKFLVVHNGIIENYQELRKELSDFRFVSDTDTEVIPMLIEKYQDLGFEGAVRKAISRLEGMFAVLAVDLESKKIVAARNGSPLIIGKGEDGYFAASDIPAFLEHTKKVIYLDDNDLAVLSEDGVAFSTLDGNKLEKSIVEVDWDAKQAEKGEYPHFMLKEIMEQKETILRAANQDDEKIKEMTEIINGAYGTFFTGCGTAGKVGHCGEYLFSRIAKKHINYLVASEFANYRHFMNPNTLMISISQSGETADVLEAIKTAKKKFVQTACVVNVNGSSIARRSDWTFLVNAGPEKAVCSTKATTSQLAVLTLLAYACDKRLEEGKQLLERTSSLVNEMLDDAFDKKIRELAVKLKDKENMYIIGRGMNYPMALEAAIKIQEVSYIHAEGFAGGELKHGPIALIEEGTPCVAFVAEDETKHDMISNAVELRSRGAYIIGIAPENNEVFDFWIKVPEAGNASPIVNIIPVQLLAYHLALERGCDPDYPRNLAKCVSVK